MISKEVLSIYKDELDKGLKVLKSYKRLFLFLGFLTLTISVFFSAVSIIALLDGRFANELSVDDIVHFFNNVYFFKLSFLIGFGSFIPSLLLIKFHFIVKRKKLKKYIEESHNLILSRHKKIFKDHSDATLKSFSEERNYKNLIQTLTFQSSNINFFINNYDNFDCPNTNYEYTDNEEAENNEVDDDDDLDTTEIKSS